MTNKSPSAYVDPTPGVHGNRTTGLGSLDTSVENFKPFDGAMREAYEARLARWGYTDEELDADGILGDMVRDTAKLGTISEYLWRALLQAAACGNRERVEMLEHRYGKRISQSLRWHKELLETIGEAKSTTIDYQDILEAQRLADKDSHNGP